MKIGIDISQTAYTGGVGEYLVNLVNELVTLDSENEYILFFSSLRKTVQNSKFKIQNNNSKVKIKTFLLPPSFLDLLWNKLHILPIENFIGNVDVFISSDWTEPPVRKAKKITILYDLLVYKYPNEMDKKIVATQKRKLGWALKECERFICISESTKKDAEELLGLKSDRLVVGYPGV